MTRTQVYTVTGSLCKNLDVLASDITLPQVEIGDFVVIEKSS